MTHLALYDPGTLIAQEFRKALDDCTLAIEQASAFTTDDDEVGNLLDLAGSAVRVEPYTPDVLGKIGLLVCAASRHAQCAELLNDVSKSKQPPAVLLLAPDTPSSIGRPFVEGVNLETLEGSTMVSPNASVVLLTQLATGLQKLPVASIDATVLQPASTLGQEAISEVFGQARSLLTFDGKLPTEQFDRQVAFSSCLATRGGTDLDRHAQIEALLVGPADSGLPSMQTIQSGSFHGLGMSVSVRFSKATKSSALETAFQGLGLGWTAARLDDESGFEDSDHATIDRAEDDVASMRWRLSRGGSQAWLWITADNLVRGNARNSVAILEAWLTANS